MRSEQAQKQRGFTLIETLVAISVLLVAITGPMTIASRGIASSSFAKQQLTASYLAQEAIEYIHNVRTTNSLEGGSFTDGLSECIGMVCYLDVWEGGDPFTTCSGACPRLQFSESSGRYRHGQSGGAWADSLFTRSINIATSGSDTMLVTVTVRWFSNLINEKTITVTDTLYDWQ